MPASCSGVNSSSGPPCRGPGTSAPPVVPGAVSRVLTLPPRRRPWSALVVPWGRWCARSRLAAHPEDAEQQRGHTDDPDDDALGHRADAPDPEAARVGLLLDRLDVVDDGALLVGGELVVPEDRHVLRAGQHRGVDVEVVGVLETGSPLAGGEGSALADEVVAGRAVEAEQLPALGEVAVAQVAGGQRGPAAVGLDVGHQLVDLLVGEDSRLVRALGLLADQRHAAGVHLEVDGGLADADQRGTAGGHALEVLAVAGDAAALVERTTGGLGGGLGGVALVGSPGGGERRV